MTSFHNRTVELEATGMPLAEAIAQTAYEETHPSPSVAYVTGPDGRVASVPRRR